MTDAAYPPIYCKENYEEYCRQMELDYAGTIIRPATYEQWVAFNEAIDAHTD